MYRHQHRGGELSTAIVWGAGLMIGFLLLRAFLLGLFLVGGIVWAVTANWYRLPRGVARFLFVAGVIFVLACILILSLDDAR